MSGWANIQNWLRSQLALILGIVIFISVLVYLIWVVLSPVLLAAALLAKF